jgi:hypothetical protein
VVKGFIGEAYLEESDRWKEGGLAWFGFGNPNEVPEVVGRDWIRGLGPSRFAKTATGLNNLDDLPWVNS